jgi:hypothetical protein
MSDLPERLECYSPCQGTATRRADSVIACDSCGRVGLSEEAIHETSNGGKLFTGGDEDKIVRLVGVVRMPIDTYWMKPWVVVKSPYEAKDDLKALDEEGTGRRWSDDLSAWVVQLHAKETLKNHLRECGWQVVDFTKGRQKE